MVMETETEEDGKGEKIRGGRAILSKEQMCLQYTEGKGRSCSDPLPPSAEQRMNRFRFVYLGNAMLDRRYTQAMLPWIIAEVKRKKERQEIGLIVEYMAVKAVDCSTGDVIFQHKVQTITRCARSADKKCFAYLTKSPQDVSSCFCYVFEASDQLSVPGFLQSIKQAAKHDNSQKNVDSNKSRESNIPVRFSQTTLNRATDSMVSYALWYVGKLVVSHRQAPPTLIDDSVERFSRLNKRLDLQMQLKAQKGEKAAEKHRTELTIQIAPSPLPEKKVLHKSVAKASSLDNGLTGLTVCEEARDRSISNDNLPPGNLEYLSRPRSASDGDKTNKWLSSLKEEGNVASTPKTHRRTGSFGDEAHRNVIFRITTQSVSLISETTKAVLMERKLREISFCQQGTKEPDHFGFICRDVRSNQYNCYVFKGATEPLVDNVMKSLKQAFHTAWHATGPTSVCELCPLHNLHQLCVQLEGLSTVQQHDTLKKHLTNLSETEMNELTERYEAESPIVDMNEENDIVMGILRALYEKRQQNHSHAFPPQYPRDMKTGPNLLQKAKKSLANSFESFRNKRARAKSTLRADSIDETNENMQADDGVKPSPSPKRRSHTFSFETVQSPKSTTPPMSPITKSTSKNHETLTNTPSLPRHKPPLKEKRSTGSLSDDAFCSNSTPPDTPTKLTTLHHRRVHRTQSYRQHIFHSVVTPTKKDSVSSTSHELTSQSWSDVTGRKRTTAELRALWRKAIMEQILLIRMENENKTLEVHQDAMEVKRLKLDYEEQLPCSEEAAEKWNELLKTSGKIEQSILREAVKAGVPKLKRGEVWQFLIKQHQLHNPGQPLPHWRRRSRCYESVKDVPTSHQHSIFIDLGRTFPSHPYFATPLGQGQMALFSLLKGYSVVDEEVGYCQGLSFVAGMLLMHLEEREAFEALCHILFHLGIRKQYKPTMQELQVQFYMLTRLMHDYHESLYEHLEELEVTPTLYAAPWFLTLFASHYPTGFVARVLDMIFLEGIHVIFKVILSLMGRYKDKLLECDGFEEVVDFTKSSLPMLAVQNTNSVVAEVLATDITKDIASYEVEYEVLNEEAVNVKSFEEAEKSRIQELESENLVLKRQVETLTEQLSSTRNTIHSLESSISTMQMNQEDLLAIIRSVTCERDCLQKEMERFAKHKTSTLSFDEGSNASDRLIESSNASGDLLSFEKTLSKTNASEVAENSTCCGNDPVKELNTSPSLTDDSFEHIDSDDVTDEEVEALDRDLQANRLTEQGHEATSPLLSSRGEDLAVSR